ncbi:MAG: BamA/TamA family outer membrane protein [Bacteroidota bacterium]
MKRAVFLLVGLIALFPTLTSSQFHYFGRNKVQYTDFDWHVLKTEHFDIYYYPEMKELAERGAYFAEESYANLQEKFNHNVQHRIPLIFYSTHLHFQQTNTTPGFIPEGVGGFFEFLKGRVVIPSNGSLHDFQHVIQHELVHVFMHSKIGRVLIDHREDQSRFPPLWFTEGLAEYWSTKWDSQAEMILRDAVLNDHLVPLSEMDYIFGTYLMYKEGQNILQYIAAHYGEEKILLLMENFWKASSFKKVMKITVGKNYKEFDEEWIYALKKQYYPLLADNDSPSKVSTSLVTDGFNSKPVYYQHANERTVFFIGNHTGYTSVFRKSIDSPEEKPEAIIPGEKTDEFEAFHLFQSRMDVSKDGILAFVTKSGENDVFHLYDIEKKRVTETLRFRDLVALGSVSWAPDGKRLVFTSIDKSGNNDLYIYDLEKKVLQRLTNDYFDDRDPAWSPRGRKIAFSSDRTPFGQHGKYNLFLYDLHTGDIEYLTYGDQNDLSPAWSRDGRKLAFTSDRGGGQNIWTMDFSSTGLRVALAETASWGEGPSLATQELARLPTVLHRVTNLTTAAFDPAWTNGDELIFTAFENFSFQIRMISGIQSLIDSSMTKEQVVLLEKENPWAPNSVAGSSEVQTLRYAGKYSLDIAQSQISTDPVFGTSGGALVALSDVLGNDQYYFLLYNSAQSQAEFLESWNIAITRVSLFQRTNYAYGIFHFSGRRYDLRDPDLFFFERVFGGYFALSYPLSKFKRIEVSTSLANSDKEVIEGVKERKALLLSNSLTFVHDNSLWGPSGPLDGNRFKLTLAYTSDILFSNVNYYTVILDYRHYFRLSRRSAYATRFWIFWNEGKESRRFFMGGSWDLRGWPRWSLRGRKLWLISNEIRFPFIDQFGIRFPFGGVAFGAFRGALFFDAGSAWDFKYRQTYGSVGGGVRLNLAGVLVLRYDIGKRIENDFVRLQEGVFHQFFFGWDF